MRRNNYRFCASADKGCKFYVCIYHSGKVWMIYCKYTTLKRNIWLTDRQRNAEFVGGASLSNHRWARRRSGERERKLSKLKPEVKTGELFWFFSSLVCSRIDPSTVVLVLLWQTIEKVSDAEPNRITRKTFHCYSANLCPVIYLATQGPSGATKTTDLNQCARYMETRCWRKNAYTRTEPNYEHSPTR